MFKAFILFAESNVLIGCTIFLKRRIIIYGPEVNGQEKLCFSTDYTVMQLKFTGIFPAAAIKGFIVKSLRKFQFFVKIY
ncbi:hypothetical protein SMSP2_00481 [Limihaloglobus sulfuriphilus]|uniref:Uncharacterized protein n=1 Tax=Limihaloglobus sulfuriphilus TaxID=1851148 RepID=A0A1Q2MBV6_9BACT|nr:hypothetical protein SMSP2_00481 [Limihaloglobus sulfuriphilus]